MNKKLKENDNNKTVQTRCLFFYEVNGDFIF